MFIQRGHNNFDIQLADIPTFTNTYSLDYDGVDDYVGVDNISSLNNATSLSFSGWVKKTSGNVVGFESYVNSTDRIILYWWSNNTVYFGVRNGSSSPSASSSLTIYDWNHIAGTFDGATNTIKLYINGVLASTKTSQPSSTSANVGSNFKIGISNNTTYNNGFIDEVSVYDKVLTQEEITSIASAPIDLTDLSPIAWYRMGDNGAYKSPQWLLPNNENKDKLSNYSFDFDGVDDKVSLTSLIPLGLTSISFWMKSTHSSGNDSITSGLGNLGFIGTTPLVALASANYRYFADQASKFDGEWHHWFLLIAGSGQSDITNSRLFVDGVEISSGTTISSGTPSSWTNTQIGRGNYGYLNCSINNFAVWEGSDESANVSTIYNSGTPNDISSLSPTVWLKMGEEATFSGGVWTVPDSVGSNNGASNGMTIEDRIGEAPNSENNALSYNMDLVDRTTDVPT